jgi:hypothetical protein
MATQSECSAHLFCSVQRFREMLDAGTITRRAQGEYDLSEVRREALQHLRDQAAGRGSTPSLAAERANLARHQAKIAAIKAARLSGGLVEA